MLVILLPAATLADTAAPDPSAALAWLLSPDGLSVARQGQSAPALMPRADTVVAVLPAPAIAWHRPVAPRAPAARLRAALGGLLEEQLLSDDDDTHLALAPRVVAGAPVWVAALHKPALARQLAALAAAGLVVDRLVPALAPLLAADDSTLATTPATAMPGATTASAGAAPAGPPEVAAPPAATPEPTGHCFTSVDAEGADTLWLAWSDADGALCLPLAGALAKALLPRWLARGARFSATPAAAAAAEAWLGAPVAVRSDAEQALAAVRTRWNLLQFDLAPKNRGSMALGKLGRQLLSPAWRPARLGLLALLLLQVLGLNLMAWQQERRLVGQRAEMEALLRSAHPQVRAVLDAPVQMQRETAALRVAAGVPGDEDLEPLLAAAAAAWPDGMPPAAQLRFETGRLNLPATGWAPPQIDQLRARLRLAGWSLDNAEGRLLIRRADDGGAPASQNPNPAARRP
jgi:general secretion pathway protein L